MASMERAKSGAVSEMWLDGPVEGVPPLLTPMAHGLIQAFADVRRAAEGLSVEELWARPGGAASVGFHLKHIAGSTDRLVTYAKGIPLSSAQVAGIKLEGVPGTPPAGVEELLSGVEAAIEGALDALRATAPESLLEFRGVGKAQRPSTVHGLLSHAAEHAQRHAGQVITTVKILRGTAAA